MACFNTREEALDESDSSGCVWPGRGAETPGAEHVMDYTARDLDVGLLSTESSDDLRALTGFVDAGTLVPVIDRQYPLAEAAAAITRITEGHARGKVVLTV